MAKLEDELAALKSQKAVGELARDDMLKREKRLAREVRQLKFLNEQKDKQIEALADAPRERDEYRALAEMRRKDLVLLRRRIEELNALIRQLGGRVPTTATGPASGPTPTP